MNQIDHLVYASPTLEQGMEEIESLTGVKPVIGGKHPQWGTWNALISLGTDMFFEIISLDPGQANFSGPIIFELDKITESKLVRWVAKSYQIPEKTKSAESAGFFMGGVIDGQRKKQDGTILQWSLSDPAINPGDGLVPFFIDWKDTPHPGSATPEGCSLVSLTGVHPDPPGIHHKLAVLGLELVIQEGREPALLAELQTPKGLVRIS
jgi:hypothetical protein